MSYRDLLLSQEWQDKRTEIIRRDRFKCQCCHNKSLFENFHFSPFWYKSTATEGLYRVIVFPLETGVFLNGFIDTQSNPELIAHVSNKLPLKSLMSFSIGENSAVIEAQFELPFKLDSNHKCLNPSSELPSKQIQKLRMLSKEKVTSEILRKIDYIKWHYVKGLHVHHKFYKINTLPWDYNNDALVTYCWECHLKLHEEQDVNLIDNNGNIITSLTPCKRCHGAGWIPKYSHIEGGICFKCYGAKFLELIENDFISQDESSQVKTEIIRSVAIHQALSSKEQLKTIEISNHFWMVENLNVSNFRNGDEIAEARSDEEWQKIGKERKPAWCYYKNDPRYGKKFGKLYNWYAVNDVRGLAPKGWHIPTEEELATLTIFLGGYSVAGDKMKESGAAHWKSPNSGSTNNSGFTALPGGCRLFNGTFDHIAYYGYWWSSTENSTSSAWYRYLNCSDSDFKRSSHNKRYGFSVRCLRDF